jgi:monovalent cation:H+ antiporter-2, CPA2 family
LSSAVLLIELGAIIVGLAILARLAGRLGFSPIPLYLLAGLAFGQGGLLPLETVEEFVEIGAELGVVLLLFMLGLEYSADELRDTLRGGAATTLIDLGLNFTPGFLAGFLLGLGPVGAIVLGGITYISSSGIVAKLVDDLEWVGNREIPGVLSVIVLEDLVMALYLPVVAVLLLGSGIVTSILTVGAALVAVVAILVLALRFGPKLSAAIFSRSDEALLLSIFGATVLVAGVAASLRVSAAVGAFLVGIALSGPAADRAQDLLSPLRDLFGAAFFLFFSLRIDPGSLPPVLLPALALAGIGLLTKLATGWVVARRDGVGRWGRLRAGSALTARGEFSVAIAALGVSGGVAARLGPFTAAYVLLLALAAPVLSRLADAAGHRARAGRRSVETGTPTADRESLGWENGTPETDRREGET